MSVKHLLSDLSPSLDAQQAFGTEGRKHNKELFEVTLEGEVWNVLVSYLRERAQKADSYLETKNNVIIAETIHAQLKAQGF